MSLSLSYQKSSFEKATQKPYHLALFVIVLFAFVIRIFPRLLLPYFYMDDETINMVIPILKMIHSHSLDPHFYKYGSLISYLNIPIYEIYFHLMHIAPLPPPSLDFLNPSLYYIGRYESAVFDVLTILVTYKIGERLFNKKVAFLALIFMVFNPLELFMSHLFKPDTFMTFFAMCVFYFSIRLKEKEQLRWYVLAGIFSGFAMSTRLDFFVLLMPITGWFIYYYKTPVSDSTHKQTIVIPSLPPLEKGGRGDLPLEKGWGAKTEFGSGEFEVSSPPFSKALQKRRNIAVFLLVAFIAFFLTSPYLVLHIPEFMHAIFHEFTYEQNINLENNILHKRFVAQFLIVFPFMLSISIYALSMYGIYLYAKHGGLYEAMLYLIYPFIYFLITTLVSDRPSYAGGGYFYLAILPFIILLAAYSFMYVLDKLRNKGAQILIIVIVFIDIFFASSNFISSIYNYNRLGYWADKNIPSKSAILILNTFRPVFQWKYYVYPIYTETIKRDPPLKYSMKIINPDFVIATGFDIYLEGGHTYFSHLMKTDHYHEVKIFRPYFAPYIYMFSLFAPEVRSGEIYVYKNH